MEKEFCEYKSTIPQGMVESENYQRELEKLKKYYGIRATLKSYGQAAWDKEGAICRLAPCYQLWLRVEAAKDILGADFAFKVHNLLADDKTAEEIIKALGSFEEYLKEEIYGETSKVFWGSAILGILKRTKRQWWFEY